MNRHLENAFITVVIGLFMYSCNCSCLCDRNMGCAIAEAKSASGAVIERQLYCSLTNYDTDKAVNDSVTKFRERYLNSNVTVTIRDSIYETEQLKGLTCNDANDLKRQGYGCYCAK